MCARDVERADDDADDEDEEEEEIKIGEVSVVGERGGGGTAKEAKGGSASCEDTASCVRASTPCAGSFTGCSVIRLKRCVCAKMLLRRAPPECARAHTHTHTNTLAHRHELWYKSDTIAAHTFQSHRRRWK
jgi:hypothetical protein